jgi:hypothetical protein
MKNSLVLALAAALALSASAWAGDGFLDDFVGYYAHREEGVSIGAGNAKEANSAIHTVDPWPPYAKNRRIPASGERMTRALERYQDVSKLNEAARALAPDAISAKGVGGNQVSSGR